jgi:hypothetical protein
VSIVIRPYAEEDASAVARFNDRLAASGRPPDFRFPESHVPAWLPPTAGDRPYNEYYLALDDGVVRGGYAVKHQNFSVGGVVRPLAYYHHPLSEGICNQAYQHIGPQLLMHALRVQPLLYALGMRGYDRPLPRMLRALGWPHCLIPFYFRVLAPKRFLEHLHLLRARKPLRTLAKLAGGSGAGGLAIDILQKCAIKLSGRVAPGRAELVPDFGEWADAVWRDCPARYPFVAVRNFATLQALYPAASSHFIRLRVKCGAQIVGWAVGILTRGREAYGDLQVAQLMDCVALPEHAGSVVTAATAVLQDCGAEVIISNQSHSLWRLALRQAGFLRGTSNFIFAASRRLAALLGSFTDAIPAMHLNRGDADGSYELVQDQPVCVNSEVIVA